MLKLFVGPVREIFKRFLFTFFVNCTDENDKLIFNKAIIPVLVRLSFRLPVPTFICLIQTGLVSDYSGSDSASVVFIKVFVKWSSVIFGAQ